MVDNLDQSQAPQTGIPQAPINQPQSAPQVPPVAPPITPSVQPPQPQQVATPQTPPPPANPNPAPGNAQPKKGHGCIIAFIVVFVILVVLGIGTYFGIRYFANKAKNALEGAVKTQTGNLIQGATNSLVSAIPEASGIAGSIASGATGALSGNKEGADFATVAEQTPSGDFPEKVNGDAKPILTSVFGGAKVDQWSVPTQGSVYLSYITKNSVTSSDSTKVESAFTSAGFQTETSQSSSEGMIVNMSNSEYQVSITNISSPSANGITVIANKK